MKPLAADTICRVNEKEQPQDEFWQYGPDAANTTWYLTGRTGRAGAFASHLHLRHRARRAESVVGKHLQTGGSAESARDGSFFTIDRSGPWRGGDGRGHPGQEIRGDSAGGG